MLEHVTYCGFTLQICKKRRPTGVKRLEGRETEVLTIRTQAWTRSEFCDIYDFGGELLTGLTMDASSYYAKWSPGTKEINRISSSIASQIEKLFSRLTTAHRYFKIDVSLKFQRKICQWRRVCQ
jgi:hypothetical protein